MDHKWKLCILLITATAVITAEEIDDPCTWKIAEPGFYSYCHIADHYEATCENRVNYTLKPCKDENKNYEIVDNFDYNLKITVLHPLGDNLFPVDVHKFIKLTLVEGNLTSIPDNVYKMDRLIELRILRNKISNVNFYKFVPLSSLNEIDLSENQITDIGSEDGVSDNNTSVTSIDLSYNLIEVVPNNFVRPFHKLERLNLSHNKISSIGLLAFDGITHLKTLDISNNMLTEIGYVFPTLPKLQELLLSNNQLTKFPDSIFNKLTSLEKLDVRSNMIEHIDLLTFEGLVHLKILDISNNSIVRFGYAFAALSELQELYISRNKVEKLLVNNLITLTNLEVLDVGYNDIRTIETDAFQTLTKLTALDLRRNKIETIPKRMFTNNNNLTWLSLLDNQIEFIEPNTFRNKAISNFYIKNNKLTGPIATSTFSGINIPELDLSVGNITSIGDEAFADMNRLKYLNLSTNAINNISYNAFSSLVSLDVLDLSYNKLKNLKLESANLRNLRKLYAQHNNIENIITNVFENFVSLQELDLSYNEIKAIEPHQFLNKLTYLDLSYNSDMKIIDDPFKGITQLNRLSLQHVRTGITFENSSTSVRVLEMQSCGIIDMNIVFIYNIKNVVSLNLSMNEVAVIDRNTFKSMPSLVILDLSLNKITFIQPGSFLQTKSLNILNLYGNSLKSIQYGVFDGLDGLNDLNLAKNALSRYDVKLKPVISKLYLDDNCITNFNFKELFSTETTQLSIGGNQIPCAVFADLKYSNYSEKFSQVVTAKSLNYYTENINGISCQNGPNDTSVVPVTQNPITYINPLISLLKTSLDQITTSLKSINENTHKTEKSMKDLIESSNNFLVANNEKITNITNQLQIIKKIIDHDESNWNGTLYFPITDAPTDNYSSE